MEIEKLQIKYLLINSHIKDSSTPLIRHQKILPHLSIVQSVKGSYGIKIGNRDTESTESGGFFIAPANTLQTIDHNLDPKSQTMENRWLFIDMVINGKYRPDFIYDFPTILPRERQSEMNSLFEELFHADDIFDKYSICYQIMKLLLSLGTPKVSIHGKDLQNVISYIIQNYSSPITMEDLANAAHMSQSNLHAIFKKQFAISPISYINHYRITLAAEELLQTDKPIGDIAKSVGIPDQLYFSKLFKKIHGASPREYRNIN